LTLVELPLAGLAMPGLDRGGKIAVVPDDRGVAEALVAALRERGFEADRCEATELAADVAGVVYLGGLRQVDDVDAALAICTEGFVVAKAFAKRATEQGGVWLSVQDTGGDFGLSGSERAWLGGLAGLAKTAAREWPRASVKAIDLQCADRAAEQLAEVLRDELLSGGVDLEVALRADGKRMGLQSAASAISGDRAPVVDSSSVIVASGGARGVTATTLIALARDCQPRFALLGRTPLQDEPQSCRGVSGDAALKKALLVAAKAEGRLPKPAELGAKVRRILAAREVRATLAALQHAGSEAQYYAAAIQDESSVAAALEQVRANWGPITGVVHGAGVLADKRIADKTIDQLELVMSTKVGGLRSLLAATAVDPLAFICLFSSVAARTGNAGQCDYAMANEILNKVAALEQRRRGGACLVKSMNWGPWEGGMVTPALERHFRAAGVPLIGLDRGAEMLVQELQRSEPAQIEVVLGGPPEGWLNAEGAGEAVSFGVRWGLDTHPYLDGHRVKGGVVVPVVVVLEWFCRAARALCPQLELVACSKLKVLRGIRFDDPSGSELTIRCKPLSDHRFELELASPSGIAHYRAEALFQPATAVRSDSVPADSVPAFPPLKPLDPPTIYDGEVLFHRGAFQVIREVVGVCEQGIVGQLGGIVAQDWPSDDWQTDVAMLDGGLQLAVLWSGRTLGGPVLPTALGAYRHNGLPVEGLVRCEVRSRVVGSSKTESDLRFLSEDNHLIAQIEGLQIHRRP